MFTRFYQDLTSYLQVNRALIIYGPRRVGKTTMVERYLQNYSGKYRLVSGEDLRVQNILSSNDFGKILEFCEGLDLLAIDEAQTIENIGLGLKIIVDQVKDIKIIATGSSSFDLANKIGEPLVGRSNILKLFPIAQLELLKDCSKYELKQNLESYLRFGAYPEILTMQNDDDKREYLSKIVDSYLYKDILALNMVKNSEILQKLVKKLAFSIGSEVAPNHFAGDLGVDVKTVARYLDLLEKNFIIMKLQGFSRNLAKEITKKHKYYFYDLGIRNAVINQFNMLEDRNDIGALWENFVILERIKRNCYLRSFHNSYFWRTYRQYEIDYIEEKDAKLDAFEIKWNAKSNNQKSLALFSNIYPNVSTNFINKENYLGFIS